MRFRGRGRCSYKWNGLLFKVLMYLILLVSFGRDVVIPSTRGEKTGYQSGFETFIIVWGNRK